MLGSNLKLEVTNEKNKENGSFAAKPACIGFPLCTTWFSSSALGALPSK